MYVKINLLPKSYYETKAAKGLIWLFAAILIAMIIGGIFWKIQIDKQIAEVQQKIDVANGYKNQIDAINQEISNRQNEVAYYQIRVDAIQKVLDFNKTIHEPFDEVARWTYEKVQYTSLSINGTSVTIRGRARSLNDVARYILNLYQATDTFNPGSITLTVDGMGSGTGASGAMGGRPGMPGAPSGMSGAPGAPGAMPGGPSAMPGAPAGAPGAMPGGSGMSPAAIAAPATSAPTTSAMTGAPVNRPGMPGAPGAMPGAMGAGMPGGISGMPGATLGNSSSSTWINFTVSATLKKALTSPGFSLASASQDMSGMGGAMGPGMGGAMGPGMGAGMPGSVNGIPGAAAIPGASQMAAGSPGQRAANASSNED